MAKRPKRAELREPILLGDCPIVVRTEADAMRAANWVEERFWQKVREQADV